MYPVRQAKYTYLWKAYVIKLSKNPLVCDCIMSAVAQEIGKLLQEHVLVRSRFDTWQCHWPLELKRLGRPCTSKDVRVSLPCCSSTKFQHFMSMCLVYGAML